MRRNIGEESVKRWVLALTSIASLMAVLDAMVVATTLNTIRVQLHASIVRPRIFSPGVVLGL